MFMKLLSFIIAVVMTLTSIPVTSETAIKVTDAVNSAVEWVVDVFSSSKDAEDNSASVEAMPENDASNSADTSEEKDFEVTEQAMDDERDPTDGNEISAKIDGTYKQTSSWGHVNTEAQIDTYFEIYGLHAVNNSSTATVALPGDSGGGKTYNFGSKASGRSGTFYYDLNNMNDIGKNYGVTNFSSVGLYVQNQATSDTRTVTVSASNSNYNFTPTTLDVPNKNSSKYASPNFRPSGSTGTSHTVTYTFAVQSKVKDESTVNISGGTSMSVMYIYVNTYALWNLYQAEANTGAGTSKRAQYKTSYTAADASAWNKYEEALVSARKVLCGGVPQSTINAEYNALRQAVLNLKIRGQFKTTGCTNSVSPHYFTANLFTNVVARDDGATYQPTYTYNTITPTTPAGCWLDATRLEKTGYSFKRWKHFISYNSSTTYFDNSGTNAKYTFVVQDTYSTPVAFEPEWDVMTYTIHFDENIPEDCFGELVGMDTPSITLTWEDQSQLFPSCSWLVHKELPDGNIMNNYMKFRAWSINPNSASGYTNLAGNVIYASDFFTGSSTETREITLYALWKNNVGSVTLDFNYSGTISDIKDYQQKPLTSRTVFKTMVLNTTWALNVNPYSTFYREGYNFDGWYTEPEGGVKNNAATPTEDKPEITLFAHWSKKAYYINVNYNDGAPTGEYDIWLNSIVDGQDIIKVDRQNLRVVYGTRFNLPTADCMQRTGYSFYAWELNGVEYQPGAQVAIADYGPNNTNVTLRAIWQRNQTSFTLHYNNGQPDVTFSGLYGDAVPAVYAVYFTPDTTGMNDFQATSNSWYTRTENADGSYTYSPYRQTTAFPAESVDLYCGWIMKRLTQAVCNDCNGKMGVSDYVRVNKDTGTLDFLYLERDPGLYEEGKLYYYDEASRANLTDAFNVAKQYLTDLSPNSTKNILFDYSLKEEIEQAAVGIYDALNLMAYNPADYSRVEAQIARINQIRDGSFLYEKSDPPLENCGIGTFTAATWRQVELAEGKVRYDYLTTNQAAVDIFASNIDEAISGLMLKADVEDWSPLVEVLNLYTTTFTEYEATQEEITLKGATYNLWVSQTNADGTKIFLDTFDQDLLALADEYFRSARELLTDSVDATTFDLDETVAVLYDLINEILSTEAAGDYSKIIELWNQYLSMNTAPYKLEYRQQFVEAYRAVDWTLTASHQTTINGYYNTMNSILSTMRNNLDQFTITTENGTGVATQNVEFIVNYGTSIIDLLETPVRNGYKFAGWFIDENCTIPLDNTVATYDLKVYALWLEDVAKFNVEVYFDGEGAVSVNNAASDFADFNKVFDKNTNVFLSAAPLSGYEFIGWMDMTSGKLISTEATYTATLVSDLKLIALFAPIAEDTYTVIFKDKNGVILDKQEVSANDSAIAPDMSYFYYDGYVFDGWDKDFSDVTEDMVVNAVYVRTADYYTLSVEGGKITTKLNADAVKYNTKVTVTVDETVVPEGMVFAGWSIDNGKSIVSYATEYTFYLVTNTKVVAVYAEEVAEETPTIYLSAIINGDKLSFVSERSLPNDRYTFIESGILLTADAEYSNALTLENASTYSAIKHGKTASTSADGQYKVTLNATPNKEYFAVSYLAYVDMYGKIQVIYTDLYSVVI